MMISAACAAIQPCTPGTRGNKSSTMNSKTTNRKLWRLKRCLSAATRFPSPVAIADLAPLVVLPIRQISLRFGSYFPAFLDTKQAFGAQCKQRNDHDKSGRGLVLRSEIGSSQIFCYADH